jgi:transposase
MYLRINHSPKGDYLSICEKFRDPKSGVPKDRVVQKIGYAHDYKSEYDDPILHFRQLARQMTDEKKSSSVKRVTIKMDEEMKSDEDSLRNVGYCVLKSLYRDMELSKFWKFVTRDMDIQYDADKIFQMLVYSRILFPASKKKTYEQRSQLFEDFGDFSLDDVYNALTVFGQHEAELQKWIYDHTVTKYHRDLGTAYFDCTNYYYDISKPDIDDMDEDGNVLLKRYRKYGPEKNHRKDPIVELGLLMDASGIPLAYDLFPGNESEKVHMLPIINRTRKDYGIGRIIVVADRGLNTSDNIFKLNGTNRQKNNSRDGYVYGQSVRGADAEFKAWVLDQKEYEDTRIEASPENMQADDAEVKDSDTVIFRHKSRIYPRTITITREYSDGHTGKQKIVIDQKQMVYYSAKYAKKQKLERDRAVERAKDLIAHPKKYDKVSAKGASGYVMNLSFSKETGEVVDKNLELDEAKIKEEEKYDGYYSIVTSELNLTDIEIRKIYRGLARIEETFKITKSEFDTRPIYVRTNDHIDAHFTVCFTALVIIRLLQIRLDRKYTAAQLLESLRKYSCAPFEKNTYQFHFRNEIIDDCGKAFNMKLSYKYRTQEDIRRLLKY